MLLSYFVFFSLAILGSAQQPWEINRSPTALEENGNGVRDQGPVSVFLDNSCQQQNKDLRPVLNEVIQMAREGFQRLSNNAQDFATGYAKIFGQTPADDPDFRDQVVMRVFWRISGIQLTNSLEAADIRIHCDNDDYTLLSIEQFNGPVLPRWVPCPDVMHPNGAHGDGIPNSALPFERKRYLDHRNLIYRNEGSLGVQDPDPEQGGQITTLAQTYRQRVGSATNQNAKRESITIGDLGFQQTPTLANIPGGDIVRTTMHSFDGLTSVTLFHELCHSHHILGVAASGPSELFGWQQVIDATEEIVSKAADAFAFAGLFALMNSRNIRFDGDTSNLIPLHPMVDPLKIKRSYLHSRHHTKVLTTSPRAYGTLKTRAVPFIS